MILISSSQHDYICKQIFGIRCGLCFVVQFCQDSNVVHMKRAMTTRYNWRFSKEIILILKHCTMLIKPKLEYTRRNEHDDTQDYHYAFIFLTTIITEDNGAHKHHRRYFRRVYQVDYGCYAHFTSVKVCASALNMVNNWWFSSLISISDLNFNAKSPINNIHQKIHWN